MENFIVNINDWIQENPTMFFAIIIAICVIILVLLIISGARKRAKKKKLLQGNENLVEVVFDYVVAPPGPIGGPLGNMGSTGYQLYGVNGQPPQILGRSVLVPAGPVSLDCEYFVLRQGASFAKSFGRSTYTFTALPGKKYTMSYNLLDSTLEHKEK